MTDYLNPDKLYISGRIDIAPGFDSFRDTATDGKPHPDNGVPTVKESLTTALDENGLARCGCGEKAGFHYSVIVDNDCYVECGICGEHTKVAPSEEKARDAWNTAMGYTAPSRPGAGEMDPNGDEGAES